MYLYWNNFEVNMSKVKVTTWKALQFLNESTHELQT